LELATALGGAQDAVAGRAKSQAFTVAAARCSVGHARCPPTRRPAGDLFGSQLRADRSDARKNEVMAVMAKPLTDDNVLNLAAWFNAIRVEVTAA
jgi:cytochrome c553